MTHRVALTRAARLLIAIVLLAAACSHLATRKGFYEPITAELRTGNAASAEQMLETAREKGKFAQKDRLLYFIDAGMLAHYADRYQLSNEKLEVAEVAAEELYTKSVSRAALSLLLNDNTLEYAGEDYEILYTNLVKALNYVALREFEDAFVEIRRANLKLERLQQKYGDDAANFRQDMANDSNDVEVQFDMPELRFHNDALARYLSMHMYASAGKYDDARIDHDYLVQAFEMQPHIYDFPPPDVAYRSDSGAILSVVALVGLAPTKEPINLRIRTDKDLGLVQVLYDDPSMNGAEYGHLPVNVKADYYFKFALPTLVDRPSQIGSVEVVLDGQPVGELQLIEDVSRVAQATFDAHKTLIYMRSVARAVIKGLAAHKLKKKADTGGLEGWLKKAAIDVGTDVLENADLRSAQYLPGRVLVRDFETTPGMHQVVLRLISPSGHEIGRIDQGEIQVEPEGWNLVQSSSPQ